MVGGLANPIGDPVDRLQSIPNHGDGHPKRLVVDRLCIIAGCLGRGP